VKNITDFGAFIDLDGLDGLLHITDMSWGRVKNPKEMLTVGQEIEVIVLDIDREKERVSLGHKQITNNPWESIQVQFPVGARVSGKVVNLAAYGAFVEIAPGIEGLVHISEFSWTKRVARASDMLNIGDEVQVVVLSIDVKEQKIALGIRQTMDNPWDTVLERFPVGSKITGKVRNYTAYGAFVELEEGIDGMIHVSDMSWTRKINHPSECLQKGQEVEAVVLEVNAADQRISLGLKQAQNDPWSEIAAKYAVGSTVKGKVSKIASFGAFIELEDGVDGLVHISQISDNRIEKVKDALNVGDEVEARVVKVDRAERRIGLSIRAMTMTESEIKALEAEASGEDAGSESKSSGSDNLGGLSAAFDNAFANFEWQPGETK
jgi:small subunit ribosomal protein S1